MLKPLDWLRQAWKSLEKKLFKATVIFLDNAPMPMRMRMMEMIRPNTNGMDIHSVIMQPHLVITNLSRLGDRLDFFLVRCSNRNPHFINKDCYKNAIVWGESDWVGERIDYTPDYNDWIHICPRESINIGEL